MARAKSGTKAQAKSSRGVESYSELGGWLWSAASKIRGPVDAPRYKDYILPLLFLKRLSDRYDFELAELAKKLTKGDLTKAESLVKADPQLVTFALPTNSRWDALLKTVAKGDSLGARVTTVLRGLAKVSPRLDFMVNTIDFNAETQGQRVLDDPGLLLLLTTLSERRLGPNDCEPDVLGRAYEYLLQKFAEEGAQSGGEFFTPRSAGVLMARLLDPQPGMSVYDPTCGSAGLLLKCHLHWLAKHGGQKGKVKPLSVYGQERQSSSYVIAKMNALLLDMAADIQIGDTMANPRFLVKSRLQRFDRVVANPMWNQAFAESTYANDTFDRFVYGDEYPPASSADWGWIQHMLASLADGGRMAVVIDTGAGSRGSGDGGKSKERAIRKAVVEKDLVEAVVLMPDNMFANTSAPALVMVLSKKKAHPGEVLMIDASAQFTKGRPKNEMTDAHVDRVAEAFAAWTTETALSAVVTLADIAAQDWALAPQRYVTAAAGKRVLSLDEALAAYRAAEQERVVADRALDEALKRLRTGVAVGVA